MDEQNASYLVRHSDLGAKNFIEIFLKIVLKVLKWPRQYVNFQRVPLDPPRVFLILNMLQNKFDGKNCA